MRNGMKFNSAGWIIEEKKTWPGENSLKTGDELYVDSVYLQFHMKPNIIIIDKNF